MSRIQRLNDWCMDLLDTIQPYLVEVAYFTFFLARHMTLPLFQEYVQSEIYKQHGVNNSVVDHEEIYFPPDTDKQPGPYYEAHKESVMAVLGLQMAEGLPSVVTVIILGAISDRTGKRKILLWVPAFGSLLYSVIYILILYTSWTIDGLFMASALRGLSGSMTAFYAGSTFFAINSVSPEKRAWRLAFQEFLNGAAYAIANIMVGFWVKDGDFKPPFLFTIICSAIAFLISFFLVKEVKIPERIQNTRNYTSENCCIDTFKPMGKFFRCTNRKMVKVWLAILAFQTYAIVHIGQINTLVLYLRGPPYGWPTARIGMFLSVIMGVAAIGTVSTPPVLKLILSDTSITFAGLFSKAIGTLWIAVVKNETVLYFSILLLVLELLPFPMLRSIVANGIETPDQGSLFALMHCGESISYFLAPLMFQAMYAGTLHYFTGFVFVISVIFLLLPVSFTIGIRYLDLNQPPEYEAMDGDNEMTGGETPTELEQQPTLESPLQQDGNRQISIISATAQV